MFIDFRPREGREIETSTWEENIYQLSPTYALTGDKMYTLGVCPDWESNPQLFGVCDNVPTNWTTCPGQIIYSLKI